MRLSTPAPLRAFVNGGRRAASRLAAGVMLMTGLPASSPAEATVPAAPAGQVEAGVPAFVVFGPETIGFKGLPNGLYLLPDGRVLVTSESELAYGDGVHWEAYRAQEGQPLIYKDAQIDARGRIYIGTEGAISRLAIGSDGLWRATTVQALPEAFRHTTLSGSMAIGDAWYWFGGAGSVVKWRPGATPEFVRNELAVERLFRVGDDLYASEQSSGGLYCLTRDGKRVTTIEQLSSALITAVVPFDPQTVLVATGFSGLRLFDGTKFVPFGTADITFGGSRVNDLCATTDGCFAAAVDTRGIVFFDRTGKVLQMLDARLDHRLARVQKLRYSRDGVLWGLLNEGVVRVEFPSRVSRFEPLIASGLSYAAPYRHNGNLWLLAEGRALRAEYDGIHRLEQFVRDDPPGHFVFTLASVGDALFAGSDSGIYVRTGAGWTPVAAGIVNARVGVARTPTGAIVYAARGEIGTLTKTGDTYSVHRIPVPALRDNFNAWADAHGIAWLELGGSNIARLDPNGPEPTIRILGQREGLPEGWASVFIFEGEARVQLPSHVFRLDDATGRFVDDTALLRRFPALAGASSRPQVAPDGKLWYTYLGHTWTVDLKRPGAPPRLVELPFAPLEYKFESNGVVWLRGNRRFERYDPRIAAAVSKPPRVLITSLQFPNSNRQVFNLGALKSIPYADNTIVFRFAAPGNPFADRSAFEVLLDGVSDRWVSTGSSGQVIFNRLKEGRYTFHVRTVSSSGATGGEAVLAFVVQPPWFRTPLAWTTYILGGAGVLAFMIWYPSVRQRRENAQLERVVAKRTEELNQINQQLGRQVAETTEKSNALAASEERYRTLSAELERRVEARTTELSTSNLELQQRESLFRLMFEHAPVGISWKRADLDNLHHFNGAYRRILDLDHSHEALPDYTRLLELVHPEDAPHHLELNAQIQRGETDTYRIEERFVLRNGRTVWGSMSIAVVRDESGRTIQEIGILEDITARKDAEKQLATTYKELVQTSRMAGMAEVATGVLHNVGNVLNSLNVSSNLIATNVRQSKADSLSKLSALLNERAGNLGAFLTDDPRGRLVPQLIEKLAQTAAAERDWLLQEITSMQKNIDHIKEIVAMQQSYATVIGVAETLEPESLLEDALRMNSAALSRHDVRLVKEYLPAPKVCVEKGKVLQILINVIRNAKYACDDAQQFGRREKIITVRVEAADERVRFVVRDNGVGIAPENLTRIFAHGFTTRAYGHGFGLHSSALAAREMKGSLTAHSDGVDKGATFTLEIPAAGAVGPRAGGSNPPLPA